MVPPKHSHPLLPFNFHQSYLSLDPHTTALGYWIEFLIIACLFYLIPVLVPDYLPELQFRSYQFPAQKTSFPIAIQKLSCDIIQGHPKVCPQLPSTALHLSSSCLHHTLRQIRSCFPPWTRSQLFCSICLIQSLYRGGSTPGRLVSTC